MNKLYGNQYDYLTIPKQIADSIQLEPSLIKSGNGKDAIRKIYFGQVYDKFETEQIIALKKELDGLASHYPDELLCRFLYSYKFNIQNTYQGIKMHEGWLYDPNTFQLTPLSQEYLNRGIIYIAGRDKMYRPSIVVQCGLLDSKKLNVMDFLVALNTVFMVAQQYMFYPGKIEQWIILIDSNEIGITGLPIDMLKQIIQTAAAHYVGNLEKLYLLNPSTTLSLSWSVISKFIDERSNKKIQFIKKSEQKLLHQYFDPSQVEVQFGGTLPKIEQYWPPKSTIQFQSYQKEESVRSIKSLPYQQKYQSYQPPFKMQDQQSKQSLKNSVASINRNQFQDDRILNKIKIIGIRIIEASDNKPYQNNYTNQSNTKNNNQYQYIEEQKNSIKLDSGLQFSGNFNQQQRYEESLKLQTNNFQPPDKQYQSTIQLLKSRDQSSAQLPYDNSFLQDKKNLISFQDDSQAQITNSQRFQIQDDYLDHMKQQQKFDTTFSYTQKDDGMRKSDLRKSNRQFVPPFPQALPPEPIRLEIKEDFLIQQKVTEKPKQIQQPYQDSFNNKQQVYQQQSQQQSYQVNNEQNGNGNTNLAQSQLSGMSRSRYGSCCSARDAKYTACQIF
ncbi:hypothetical protein pb186bvf_014938 [Paramecium bursaria]